MEPVTEVSKIVSISKLAKRVTLQRYLVSKILYKAKEFNLVDVFAIFENQIWLETKCRKDSQFNENFGTSLEVVSTILKQINFQTEIPERTILLLHQKIKEHLQKFVFPHRNFSHIEAQYKRLYQLTNYVPSGIPNSQLPPKTFVGKGYRDKGSARNLALDGSPKWQEVSLHRGIIHPILGEKK